MDDKDMIIIESNDGTKSEVELVTYLLSEDKTSKYIVYSKGEKPNESSDDEIIYISKLIIDDGGFKVNEIVDDEEWLYVQGLLKKIANA